MRAVDPIEVRLHPRAGGSAYGAPEEDLQQAERIERLRNIEKLAGAWRVHFEAFLLQRSDHPLDLLALKARI